MDNDYLNIEITHEVWNEKDIKKIDGKPLGLGTLRCETEIDNIETLYDYLSLIYVNCIGTAYRNGKIVGWTFQPDVDEAGGNILRVVVEII